MNTLKRDLQSVYLPVGFFYFTTFRQHFQHSQHLFHNMFKVEYEVVEFEHVYETNDDSDFKIEAVNNSSLSFNEFYDTSQDSF